MKSISYLILVFTLALNAAYSKGPLYNNNRHSDHFNAQNNQQPQPSESESTNGKHKTNLSPYPSIEKESQILHNDKQIMGDGTYHYDFETSNGIKRTEQGAADGTIQGASSYTSPDGIEIKTTYTADETGYHPVGDHIPKMPDYIVRALEYIRNHPYIEKDYYTGEVKQTSFNNKKQFTTTTKRSAYNRHSEADQKGSSHSSTNN